MAACWAAATEKDNFYKTCCHGQKGIAANAYVPADGLTDPAPETTLVHLEADTECHVNFFESEKYPAFESCCNPSSLIKSSLVRQKMRKFANHCL